METPGYSRRSLLKAGAGFSVGVVSSGAIADQKQGRTPRKAVMLGMLPQSMPLDDRMALARDLGFAGIEAPPISDLSECERLRKAADGAGIRIHSVIFGGWNAPLTSGDTEVIKRGLQEVEAGLRGASAMGADGLLLVPGIVNGAIRYADAYKRSQANIRRLIPIAARCNVQILIENVWNNFLLSPLEFARYIDEFRSRWVQAYFDCGNVVAFAWPEDWIRTLGSRIRKIHLKDYKGGPGLGGQGRFVPLLEGSINWPAVRTALSEIGFDGFMTPEQGGGDRDYLQDVSNRIDRILTVG